MTPSRKKPGVAFWGTVALAVVLAYPVSFGPACWFARPTDKIVYHGLCGADGFTYLRKVSTLYWPIGWIALKSDGRVGRAIRWYATLRDEMILVPTAPTDSDLWTSHP